MAVIVLKYGGNAMAAPDAADVVLDDVAERARAGDTIVLVHGGGPQIDVALRERGIAERRVAGLRVTDEATLAVTESVLCGTVNKALVRALLRRGVRAAGLSGQDGALLIARRMSPIGGVSLGFVGEITSVRPSVIEGLLATRMVPVVAPLAVEHDGSGALNVNADTAAGALAGALGADAYVIVTNVERVRRRLDDPDSGIERMTAGEARAYLVDGTFDGGMRPKVLGALDALERGARTARIIGGGAHPIARALAGEGTTILADP